MRFIHMFLLGYVLLVGGGALALWQIGLLDQIEPIWLGIGAIVLTGVGVMMAVSSARPSMTTAITKEG